MSPTDISPLCTLDFLPAQSVLSTLQSLGLENLIRAWA